MLFNSPIFLFCFVPAVFFTYFTISRPIRNPFLVAASIFFYSWGEPVFVGIVILSIMVDWLIGKAIYQHRTSKTAQQFYLWIGISANVGLLVYFKYAGFFIDSLNNLLDSLHTTTLSPLTIALPIGVSFIVFEKITYLVDIYRSVGKPADSITSYFLYVLLFPKLLAGPIVKFHDIADQLEARASSIQDFTEGLKRFLIGLGKKVLIADTLQEVADSTFRMSVNDLGFSNAWIGIACFTLQIYFDFSGYSDMAIGLARMLGFRLLENFNMPYLSESFTEFWRRWHISLSTWIRDYLYIALGGNRVSPVRRYFNLWLCFFLCGLWHGANWTFVLWGVYHGLFLILEKTYWLDFQKRLPRSINTMLTFLFIMMGWVIFRAESLPQAFYYLSALFGLAPTGGSFLYLSNNITFSMMIGLAICFRSKLPQFDKAMHLYNNFSWKGECELAMVLVLLILSVAKISITTFNPFLYFRF